MEMSWKEQKGFPDTGCPDGEVEKGQVSSANQKAVL